MKIHISLDNLTEDGSQKRFQFVEELSSSKTISATIKETSTRFSFNIKLNVIDKTISLR